MSTCPICGYTDTADDADVLQMAIEEHIRLSHNLDPATLGGTAGAVKPVTAATAAEVRGGSNTGNVTIPIIATAPNSGGGGTAGAGVGYGAGAAALLGAEADNDNDNNAKNRKDETSRF